MNEKQIASLKYLTSLPEWQDYLDAAEELIQKEDRISTLPKFKTATALQKHLEVKRKAFEMFRDLVTSLDFSPSPNLYQEEKINLYKTIDVKKP